MKCPRSIFHLDPTKSEIVPSQSKASQVTSIRSEDTVNTLAEKGTETATNTEKGAGFLKNLYDYHGGTFMPTKDERQDVSVSNAQLNTLFGVYLPCVQNIIGVIVFIRLYWVIGVSGVIEGMIIIGLCCLCTFLTAISLAASEDAYCLYRIHSLFCCSCNQRHCSRGWFVFPHIEIVGSSRGWSCRLLVLHWQCTGRRFIRSGCE